MITAMPSVGAIRSVVDKAPAPGQVLELAPGLLWSRMPLDEMPDHVNIFVLEEAHQWTVVDTGKNIPACAAAMDQLIAGPLAGKPIGRVLLTHFHPDHVGQAGRLAQAGAEVWATRATWLYARMSQMEYFPVPTPEHVQFAVRAGIKGMMAEALKRMPPSAYPQAVQPIPLGFRRIDEGESLHIGSRRWRVHIGEGHAPGHATFWSDDGFAIVGDHVLPGLAADLSVRVLEPEDDPVSDWYASCRRFGALATEATVCLPGHNLPFTGIPLRCEQLITTHENVLSRLLVALQRPRTAVDCLEVIYGRRLMPLEMGERLGEAIGYLNHLYRTGRIDRVLDRSGTHVWRAQTAALAARPGVVARVA